MFSKKKENPEEAENEAKKEDVPPPQQANEEEINVVGMNSGEYTIHVNILLVGVYSFLSFMFGCSSTCKT